MAYHEGELEIQRRAGVRALADRVGGIVNAEIPRAAAAFVAAQHFLILATVDSEGMPTASILGGAPGFTSARDPRTLAIVPSFGQLARVMADVDATGVIGVLAIDQATRRRIRVNGNATRTDTAILLSTAEVYSNCPQYIRPRMIRERTSAASPTTSTAATLSPAQQQWIASADTFFLATAHPQRGADASHRGGPPGFVTLESPARLSWPDFPGNNMFNSLGNLAVHPRCGLLFVDFARGATLQLRGTARVKGDEDRAVTVVIEEVVETTDAIPLWWE
jgi:predicted pyridoxine 5'-phosphate oxidase superfamily flavin-nucleotide-binding protein